MNTKPIDYSSASLLIGQTRRGALIVQCPGDVWLDIQLADQAEGALPTELQRLVGQTHLAGGHQGRVAGLVVTAVGANPAQRSVQRGVGGPCRTLPREHLRPSGFGCVA